MDVSEVCPAVEDLMCDKSEDGMDVLSYGNHSSDVVGDRLKPMPDEIPNITRRSAVSPDTKVAFIINNEWAKRSSGKRADRRERSQLSEEPSLLSADRTSDYLLRFTGLSTTSRRSTWRIYIHIFLSLGRSLPTYIA
jgi:hypothetical protein